MSRRKIRRKTHVCPNCETVLEREENYCHVCGQENHNLNVPMKDLLMEVIGSFTFFETKFIETAKIIFTHPGKLTLDFNSGKRAKYMHPVRMYFWVSAIFFFLISFTSNDDTKKSKSKKDTPIIEVSNTEKVNNDRKKVVVSDTEITEDSLDKSYNSGREFGRKLVRTFSKKRKDTVDVVVDTSVIYLGQLAFDKLKIRKDSINFFYQLTDNQLDSVLQSRHISTFYTNKKNIRNDIEKQYNLYVNEKFGVKNQTSGTDRFVAVLPNLIFIMLPIAAFILFFFERHTKWRFYFQHLVFTLNTHSAIFLMWIILILLSKGVKVIYDSDSNKTISDIIALITVFFTFLYFLIALKKVYQQNWWKTTVKFLLLTFCYGFVFFLVLIGGLFAGLIHM